MCQLLAAPKRLVGELDWGRKNSTERIACAVEIDDVVAHGVSFQITCARDRPDERVSMVLLTETMVKPRPFARIDWRGMQHGNLNRVCGDFWHVDAGRTHFHDTNLHTHIDGVAYLEISASAFSDRIFNSVAKDRCTRYGATFDGGTMLFIRVPAERLRAAIISMANLVKEVVDETILRATRAKAETARDFLFTRLDMAFGSGRVSHDVVVPG